MNIDEFERAITTDVLYYEDEDGIDWVKEGLTLFVHADGCLGARFNGELMPTEGLPWHEALDVIVNHLNAKTKEG